MSRLLSKLAGKMLISAGAAYLKLVKDARLSDKMRSVERSLLLGVDRTDLVGRLLDRPLQCLDVGARGGIQGVFAPYRQHCRFFLVEGEPAEADRLRGEGHVVVSSLIGGQMGEGVLNVTRRPGGSSTLEPTGHIMSFYAGRTDRFDVVERIRLPMVTLDDIRREHGVDFDYVKLDTQGSELEILTASEGRPLFLEAEVSLAQLYGEQGTLYQLGQLMYERGYLMADMNLRSCRPRPHGHYVASGERPSLGLPLHGDARFMPDWSRPQGLEIIRRAPRQWAALMAIFGHEEIVRYVLDLSELPDEGAIAAAMGLGS